MRWESERSSSQSHVDVRYVNVLSCRWNAQRRADWRRRAAAAAIDRCQRRSSAKARRGYALMFPSFGAVGLASVTNVERSRCKSEKRAQKRRAPRPAVPHSHSTTPLSLSFARASASAASALLPSASALLDAPMNAHCRHKRSRFSLWLSHGDTMDYPLSIHFHQRPQVTRSSARVTLLSTVHTRTACNSCELKNVKC